MEQVKFTAEEIIDLFRNLLASTQMNYIKELPEREGISVFLDFSSISMYSEEIAQLVMERPEEVLSLASESLKGILLQVDPDYVEANRRFYVRVYNLPIQTPIRELRANQIGKLVEVEGVITQASAIQARLVKGTWACENCGSLFEMEIERESPPNKRISMVCPNCGKRGAFKFLLERSTFIDWQTIRLQEDHEQLPAGRLPRSIICVLTEDLVDRARPGDRVQLTGILKPVRSFFKGEAAAASYTMYIDAISVRLRGEEEKIVEEITDEDLEEILSLARQPEIADRIIASIAPSIHGLDDIKKAVALLLFGGTPKYLADGTKIRGDLNILLIGDPGTGKSQILKHVSKIAPRGLYTTGKGSTAAGLTAAVVRDSFTGAWTLEAGALVLADKGVACIDEFDKMSGDDRVAIHEAMEQQTVSIAKAGIVATLNARSSILAAANPAWGRYDESRSPAENINLPPTILSRFDLIFLVKDVPDEKRDGAVADFILDLHAGRLAQVKQILNPNLLKRYILYARNNIHPRLTSGALEKIKQFYMEMRKKSLEQPQGAVAITPRQLEALIRMAEARAKIELRNYVTAEDAEFAINLMWTFLQQLGYEESTGSLSIDRIATGYTMSRRSRLQSLLSFIKERFEEEGRAIPIAEIVKGFAKIHEVSPGIVRDDIRALIREGQLITPYEGHIAPI